MFTLGLQIGQSGCGTDANKCVDGAKCPSGTCECDGNKHFEADGNDACSKEFSSLFWQSEKKESLVFTR